MACELVAVNAFIAAQQFNPSVFSQLWLLKSGLAAEDGFAHNCVFTQFIVQAYTPEFDLTVLPDQLWFLPKGVINGHSRIVNTKLGKIVADLPHTPFTNADLNFQWKITAEQKSLPQVTKDLFGLSHGPFASEFAELDARFGSYFSKDWRLARLRLDIKPFEPPFQPRGEEGLFLAFNFHVGLNVEPAKAEPVAAIQRLLEQWDDASELAGRMTHKLSEIT